MTDFISPEYIATFAGMCFILGMFVQFTKSIVKRYMSDVWVRIYAFIVALLIVVVVYLWKGFFGPTGPGLAMACLMAVINALAVTVTTIGGYEIITNPTATNK